MSMFLAGTRRALRFVRDTWPVAALSALALGGIVATAALGLGESRIAALRGDALHAAAVAGAETELDRDRRLLDQLAALGATSGDAAVQRWLDRMPSLAPGLRAAALYDATGMLLLRSRGGAGDSVLAALGQAAAGAAAHRPEAPLVVTQPVADADGTPLVGLVRGWSAADGAPQGIALAVLDPSSVRGFALRADGALVFAGDTAATAPRDLRPLGAAAAAAILGLIGLVAVLGHRLRAARRDSARRADTERALRDQLAAAASTADANDERSRAQSQFFAQVTHELRTPLNAILGFAETIRHEIFGPLANPRYRDYIGLIHDAGTHLLSLINDLLDNARIEAGKIDIAPIRLSAAALARSALDLVQLLADRRAIAIGTSGLAGCPDLNVDPRAMKQVLVNLLSNAIKYTPPGGRVDLGFVARDDGGVAIEVADTGIGMSAEDLRVAFEPFGRAAAGAAQRAQGTGLGLSLARALVRQHGGELTLDSRVATGTTARVLLPASAAFGASGSAAAKAPASASPARAA
ncbi:MAG TPA: ATP-binding protein [Stellaceae bacterium]|nr:ATP-binding protein [Stellaceae bacterium]